MKKLILISSLLAAGTMIAQAATVLNITSFTSSNVTTSGSTTISDGALKVVGANPATASVSLSSALSVSTGFTISMEVRVTDSTAGDSNGNAILFALGNSTSTDLFGIMMGASSPYDAAFAYSGSTTNCSVTAATNQSKSLSSLTTSTERLTVAVTSSDIKFYLGETLIGTGTKSSTTFAGSVDTIYLGSWAKSSKSYIGGETISSLAVFDTAMTGAQVIAAIPEPSFFGLFAGTLALGLAGTRRRRSKK